MVLWPKSELPRKALALNRWQRVWELGRESWNMSSDDTGKRRVVLTWVTSVLCRSHPHRWPWIFVAALWFFGWPQQSHGVWNLQRPQTQGFFCRTHSAKRLEDCELSLVLHPWRPQHFCFFGPFFRCPREWGACISTLRQAGGPTFLSRFLLFETSTVYILKELLVLAPQENVVMPS